VLLLRQKTIFKIAGLTAFVVAVFFLVYFFLQVKHEQLVVTDTHYNTLRSHNDEGRPLIHFDTLGQKENGNYVLINLQLEDLRKAWNQRVPEDSFSYEPQRNLQRYDVLLRYLASKAAPKDARGVTALSSEDIQNIKNGIPNYRLASWSYFHKRVYELVNEYDDFVHSRDVNGHSLALRLYYWQAALKVIKTHPVLGVGTGDALLEMSKVYQQDFPDLKIESYKHPHNQFLSVAVCYGFVGLAAFVFVLLYPLILLGRWLPSVYWPYFILLLVSFLTEDTLETQAGVAFYTIFNTLFCAIALVKKQQTPAG
jgi:hypothetical protein